MKKIAVIVLVILSGLTIWYLCIKEHDYQITFSTKMAQGGIYNEIKELKSWSDSDNITLVNTVLFESVTHKITRHDSSFILDWNFKRINDTITKVTVGIISEEHSIRNRLQVLIGSSSLIKAIKKEMILFGRNLAHFTDSFKVIINGESQIPEMEYVYISLRSKRLEKALEMIRSNDNLYPKLVESNLKKAGHPFVKINNWDVDTDSIQFDFAFLIEPQDSLPKLVDLKYNKIPLQKALKATYHGNYKDSDQAWFSLIQYAKNHDIEIEKKPLEVFYNNPMQGGNELEWKAEIFLPIKE